MKLIKYLFLLALIAFIGGSIYITTINGDYIVNSKQTIKAPISVVFNEVNDFNTWKYWSPWHKKEASITNNSPKKTDTGTLFVWNGKNGEKSVETSSFISDKEIVQNANLGMKNNSSMLWNFTPSKNSTEVSWTLKGTSSFMEKIYSLIKKERVEENLQSTLNEGLLLLNEYTLQQLEKHSIEAKGITDFGGGFYLYLTSSSKMDKIEEEVNTLLPKITSYMKENNITASGSPFVLYHQWNDDNNSAMFSCCIPVKERIITNNNILVGLQKPQRVFKTVLKGDRKFLKEAWDIAFKNIAERGLILPENADPFSVYTTGTQQTPNPTKWVTEIYIPVK